MQSNKQSYVLGGIFFTILGAVLFSTKAVLVKMIYRDLPISVVSLLTLRMFFSFPFYLGMLLFSRYQSSKTVKSGVLDDPKLSIGLIINCITLGVLGYYFSSFLDFSGLKFISAGLERIILFTYPTFTLVFAALLFKSTISAHQVLALLLSYAGVALAYAGDVEAGHSLDIVKGSLLVLACAVTYSLYVLFTGRLIPKVGVTFFTAVGMISATAGVFAHFLISADRVHLLLNLPGKIYLYILIMAVFATVVPSLFLSMGLNRIGSSNVAIISSIGPMATILQAWWLLGEKFGWLQAIGTILVIAGVLILGKKVGKPKSVVAELIAE